MGMTLTCARPLTHAHARVQGFKAFVIIYALYLLYCDLLISDVYSPHFFTLSTAQGPITTVIFITVS